MSRTPIPTITLIGALLLTACGTDAGSRYTTTAGDGIRTGPGITDEFIALGVLTDLTGPFKDLSTTLRAGHEIWADERNAAGGICGRRIELVVRDHGYRADTAKLHFADIGPDIAGVLELLGSPMLAAVRSDILDERISVLAISSSSQLLDTPYVIIPATTYDLEIINGLAYLLEQGRIAPGDRIGHIYLAGDYGENGLRGSRYFADRHGMQVVPARVTSIDTDMTGIVTNFRGAGVSAIVLSTTPPQTASAAASAAAFGLDGPLLGNTPTFAPALLDTPAADALARVHVATGAVPYASSLPTARRIAQRYEADYDEPPSFAVTHGYALGLIWQQVLESACTARDLSREGIHAQLTAVDRLDTDGLITPLDFSSPGSPPSRQVYIARVDRGSPGGLMQLTDLFASADALAYRGPHQR